MGNSVSSKQIPAFIYLFGVDGSGKTSLAKLLKNEFDKLGIKSKITRLRINYLFTRPILIYCKLTGYTIRKNINGVPIVYHEFHRSKWIPRIVQYLHFIDTAIMYFLKAYLPMRMAKKVIICDRFVYDVLVDFMIESRDYDLLQKKIGRFLLTLLPKNSVNVFVKIDIQNILTRKPEVSYDKYFQTKFLIYERLNKIFDFKTVDNNGAISATVAKLKIISGLLPTKKMNGFMDGEKIYLQKEKVCLGA